MNKNLFCVLFNQAKGGWIVVRESALARGVARHCGCIPMLIRCAGAALVALHPVLQAQVTAEPGAPPANRPGVEATASGTPLVQIAPPNAAGLSCNHYQQFNIDGRGLVLNNAQGPVSTQLGGPVAGNPQLGPVPASVILNQVVGTGPSLLGGLLEVAGQRADVILANPNGINCNGGGFINAARGVLTTGLPILGEDGSLTGFRILGGQLRIGEGGLKATAIDQVDLLSRELSVQGALGIDGALRVITGTNRIAYPDLGVQVIPDESGQAALGIDVGRLGGMYANRIHLIGTGAGVGVNSQGTLHAQGGPFICTSDGKILLAGKTLAQGDLQLESPSEIRHEGILAAGGTFQVQATGAFVNDRGRITADRLEIASAGLSNREGALIQTGPGQTRLEIKGALDTAAGTIQTAATDAHFRSHSLLNGAKGAIEHQGTGLLEIRTGDLNNDSGIISTRGALGVSATRDVSNRSGILQGQRFLKMHTQDLLNEGGRLVSPEGGLSVAAEGRLVNAQGTTVAGSSGGMMSGKVDAVVQGGEIDNSGIIQTGSYLSIRARDLVNGGTLNAGARLEVEAENLRNPKGHISAPALALSATHLDNSQGQVAAVDLSVSAVKLTNAGGQLNHVGEGELELKVEGALANTEGGLIHTDRKNASLEAGVLDNSGGTLAHAGTGTLTLTAGDGKGSLGNHGGTISSQGSLDITASGMDNRGGTLLAKTKVNLAGVQGDIDNSAQDGQRGFIGAEEVRLYASQGTFRNQGGSLEASRGLDVYVQDLDNGKGRVKLTAETPLTVSATGNLLNGEGLIEGQGPVRIAADKLENADGILRSGADLAVVARSVGNAGHLEAAGKLDIKAHAALNNAGRLHGEAGVSVQGGTFTNEKGSIEASTVNLKVAHLDNSRGGLKADTLGVEARDFTNAGGTLIHTGAGPLNLEVKGTLSNLQGGVIRTPQKDLVVEAGGLDNTGGIIEHGGTGGLTLRIGQGQGSAVNAGGTIATRGSLEINAARFGNPGGVLRSVGDTRIVAEDLQNAGGSVRSEADLKVESGTIGNEGILDAGRKLTLEARRTLTNRGTLQARTGASLQGGTLTNESGRILAPNLALAMDHVDNSLGDLQAESLEVKATDLTNAGGRVTHAGGGPLALAVTGTLANTQGGLILTRQEELMLKVGTLDNSGGSIAHGGTGKLDLRIGEGKGQLINAGGSIGTHGSLDIAAARVTNREGALQSRGDARIHAGRLENTEGILRSEADLSITSDSLGNSGKVEAGRNLSLRTEGALINGGSLKGGASVAIKGGTLTNGEGRIHAPRVALDMAHLDNSRGDLEADTLEVKAASLTNAGGRLTHFGPTGLALSVKGSLANTQGGLIRTNQKDLTVEAGSLDNTGGAIAHAGSGTLNLRIGEGQGPLANAGGSISTNGRLEFAATRISNEGGALTALDQVHLVAAEGGIRNGKKEEKGGAIIANRVHLETPGGDVLNAGGTIRGMEGVTLRVKALDNAGGSLTNLGPATLEVQASGVLSNDNGVMGSQGGARLSAHTVLNPQGSLQSRGDLTVTAAHVDTSGTVVAGGGLTLNTTGETVNAGSLSAGGLMKVEGGILRNPRGTINTRALAMDLGHLDNTGGEMVVDAVDIKASAVTNAQGKVSLVGNGPATLRVQGLLSNAQGGVLQTNKTDLSLVAGSLENSHGTILHGGTGTLNVRIGEGEGVVVNSQGTLATRGRLDLAAGTVKNQGGNLEGTRSLSAEIRSLDNAQGAVRNTGPGELSLGIKEGLANGGGTIAGAGRVQVKAAHIHNPKGTLLSETNLRAEAGSLDNAGGRIQAPGMVLEAGLLDNSEGEVKARDLTVVSRNLANAGGRIFHQGEGPLTLAVEGTLSNAAGGVIRTDRRDVTVNAGNLDNSAGTFTHSGSGTLALNLDKDSGEMQNAEGTLVSRGRVEVNAGRLRNEGGGLESARGLVAKVRNLDNARGSLRNNGEGPFDLNITDTLDNRGGTLASAGEGQVRVGTLHNARGTLVGDRGLRVGGGALDNADGQIHAQDLTLEMVHVDNRDGDVKARKLRVETQELINARGRMVHLGEGPMELSVAGTLSNAGEGLLQGHGADLTLSAGALENAGGTVAHGGEGTLALRIGEGRGALDNTKGTLATRGRLEISAGNLGNQGGQVEGRRGGAVTVGNLENREGNLRNTGPAELLLGVKEVLDNGGGTLASQGELNAGAEQVINHRGTLVSDTFLGIQAGILGNAQGHIHAPEMTLKVAHLDNSEGDVKAREMRVVSRDLINAGGKVLHLGEGALDLAVEGTLSNTEGGMIEARSRDLTLAPGVLDNRGGSIAHAGKGTLALLVGEGQGALLNGAGMITSEGHLEIQTSDLGNPRGFLSSRGETRVVAATIQNTQGKVQAMGGLHLDSAKDLDNVEGVLHSTTTLGAQAGSTLQNTGGRITAGGEVALKAIHLDNTRGSIGNTQAGAGGVQIRAHSHITNPEGKIASGQDLHLSSGTLAGDGKVEAVRNATVQLEGDFIHSGGNRLKAGGDLNVEVNGTFTNHVPLSAPGRVTVRSGRIENRAGGVLHGQATRVEGSGELLNEGKILGQHTEIEVQGSILNPGTLGAEGNLTLASGGGFENAGGATAGGDLHLQASQVHSTGILGAGIDAGGRIVRDGGRMKITAEGGSLEVSGQTTSGGEMVLRGREVDLSLGRTHAAGNLRIEGRNLVNTGGEARAQGSLELEVDRILNAGTLDSDSVMRIRAGSLNNENGSVKAPIVELTGERLENAQGSVTADSLDIQVSHLDNTGGSLTHLGEGDPKLAVAGALVNARGGVIQSNGASLDLAVHSLDNRGGTVSHAGTGPLSIKGPQFQGILDNAGGSITTNGRMDLAVPIIENAGGRLEGGALDMTVARAFRNREGRVIGQGTVDVKARQVDNTGGTILSQAELKVRADGDLHNTNGLLHAAGDLQVEAGGDLINREARLEAGGFGGNASRMEVRGTHVDNTVGRIVNAGSGSSEVTGRGRITNADPGGKPGGGFLGAQGPLTVHSAELHNRMGGEIVSASDLNLQLIRSLENGGGRIKAGGDLTLQAPALVASNAHGLLGAGQDLELKVAELDNSHGTIGNSREGAGTIALEVAGTLANMDGRIASGQDLRLDVGGFREIGTVQGGRDASVSLKGNLTYSGRNGITANRSLSYTVTGAFTNEAALESPGMVSVRAREIKNGMEAMVNAPTVVLRAENSLVNQGRIYGDDISLGAREFKNTAAGDPGRGDREGIVASRNSMNIGTQACVNDHASIQSEGSLSIRGRLDENNRAVDKADRILNNSGLIQTDRGNMTLEASVVQNNNLPFHVERKTESVEPNIVLIEPKRWSGDEEPVMFLESDLKRAPGPNGVDGCFLDPRFINNGDADGDPFKGVGLRLKGGIQGSLFSGDQPARWRIDDYHRYEVTRTITRDVVTDSVPARIVAGNDLVVAADSLRNDRSVIVAARKIMHIGKEELDNSGDPGQRVTTLRGQASRTDTRWKRSRRQREWYHHGAYNPAPTVESIPLDIHMGNSGAPSGAGVRLSGVPAVVARPVVPVPSGEVPAAVVQEGPAAHPAPVPGVQALGDAAQPIPDLALPASRLYQLDRADDAPFLVVTDPAYLNGRNFVGLERILDQVVLPPGITSRRLGDPFFETQFFGIQFLRLTGRVARLGDSASLSEEFVSQMDHGLDMAGPLGLRAGVMPSRDQMAGLTENCVWPVQQMITLPEGRDIPVLVPVPFVTRAMAAESRPGGALIAAESISSDLAGTLQNSGAICADSRMEIRAGDIRNQGDLLASGAGGGMDLAADRDFHSEGLIRGRRVVLEAGGDLSLVTTTVATKAASGSRTAIARVAAVQADSLDVAAGRDLDLAAARIRATGDARWKAGRDLNLGTVRTEFAEAVGSDRDHLIKEDSEDVGVQMEVGGDLTLQARGDIRGRGAALNAEGAIQGGAGGSLHLGAGERNHHRDEARYRSFSSRTSSTTEEFRAQETSRTALGTTVSGQSVSLRAAKDLTIQGSTVAATEEVLLAARGKVTVGAETQTQSSSSFERVEESGVMSSGGIGVTIGRRESQDAYDSKGSLQSAARSMVGSVQANVTILSEDAVEVKGSDVVAGEKVHIQGKRVRFDPGLDRSESHERHEVRQTGVSVSLGGGVIDQAQGLASHVEGAQTSKVSGRVGALHALIAADQASDLLGQGKAMAGAEDKAAASGVRVAVSLGASQSHSESSAQALAHDGSRVKAKGDLTVLATEGDIQAKGATLGGRRVHLDAEGNLELTSAEDTSASRGSNASSSGSIGVSAGVGKGGGGFAVDVAASVGKGHAHGDSRTHRNTEVQAEETLILRSGKDLVLDGAQARGETLLAQVGGDMRLESRQDAFLSESQQDQAGVSASIPIGAGSGGANASMSRSRTTGDYLGVNEQTGLFAGSGGFQVEVKGHTDLRGAVLASEAPAELNHFATATLGYSDLENHSHATSETTGASAGTDMASGGLKTAKGVAANVAGRGSANHSETGTTRSAVAPGEVRITDEEGQRARTGKGSAETLAGLSRDVDGAHRALDRPDLGALEEEAAEIREAGSLAVEAGLGVAGRIQTGMERSKASRAGVPEVEVSEVEAGMGESFSGEAGDGMGLTWGRGAGDPDLDREGWDLAGPSGVSEPLEHAPLFEVSEESEPGAPWRMPEAPGMEPGQGLDYGMAGMMPGAAGEMFQDFTNVVAPGGSGEGGAARQKAGMHGGKGKGRVIRRNAAGDSNSPVASHFGQSEPGPKKAPGHDNLSCLPMPMGMSQEDIAKANARLKSGEYPKWCRDLYSHLRTNAPDWTEEQAARQVMQELESRITGSADWSKWQRKSVDWVKSGKFSDLAEAWKEALKDPEWVAGAALATAGAFVRPPLPGARGIAGSGRIPGGRVKATPMPAPEAPPMPPKPSVAPPEVPLAPTVTPTSAPPWRQPALGETRVSRWMSAAEARIFKETGNIQFGAGGRVYITEVGAPKPGGTGLVRVDFNVPSASLQPAGQQGWFQILDAKRPPVTAIEVIE